MSFKCTSQYPAEIEDSVNFMTMVDMGKRFGTKIGLSDHTEGYSVALTAAVMRSIIEKHFIIDKRLTRFIFLDGAI